MKKALKLLHREERKLQMRLEGLKLIEGALTSTHPISKEDWKSLDVNWLKQAETQILLEQFQGVITYLEREIYV